MLILNFLQQLLFAKSSWLRKTMQYILSPHVKKYYITWHNNYI